MCNCNSTSTTTTICNQCAQGNPCGCPPDYSVLPQAVNCGCCPTGYVWYGPTLNYPSGYCSNGSLTKSPVPCNPCDQTISTDCVIFPSVTCSGLPAGSTVTDLAAHLCSEQFIIELLKKINTSTTLATAFCQLVNACPASAGPGSPVIGPIIVSFP
jgi:hypothetical protein